MRRARVAYFALLLAAFFLAVALARRGVEQRPEFSSALPWEEIEPARLFR